MFSGDKEVALALSLLDQNKKGIASGSLADAGSNDNDVPGGEATSASAAPFLADIGHLRRKRPRNEVDDDDGE